MITTVEEFKQVVEGDYKITDLKSYGDYKKSMWDKKATKEEIERLSPDNINSCSFWEYIEKNPELARDAVGFGITKEQSNADVNRMNFGLACDLGTLNYIWKYRHIEHLPILDIGAGYGMLKEFIEQHTKLDYYGVDVYPKVEGVKQVAADGFTLPAEIASMKFGVIVATNVFQHLSVAQRRGYYAQIEHMLYDFSVFSVSNMAVLPGRDAGFKCKDDDKSYCCHYGQYTEIQTVEEQMNDLAKHFVVLSLAQRLRDQSVTFHCVQKPQPKPQNVITLVDNTKKS